MIIYYILFGILFFVFAGGALWIWFEGLSERKHFKSMNYEQKIEKPAAERQEIKDGVHTL